MSYDRNSLLERVARLIEPEAHAAWDADYAKTKEVTHTKFRNTPLLIKSREKAEAIIELMKTEPSPETNLMGSIPPGWKLVPEEPTEQKREINDEAEILHRLANGDTIVFSMDGDMAWFTKGDRAFVGNAIISLREKGYLLRKRDSVDDADDPRGIAFFDTISESGRAMLAAAPQPVDGEPVENEESGD